MNETDKNLNMLACSPEAVQIIYLKGLVLH